MMTGSMQIQQVLGSMWSRIKQQYLDLKKYQKALMIVSLVFMLPFILFPLPSPLFNDGYATTLESREGELLGAMIAEDGQWRFPAEAVVPDKFAVCLKMFEDEYFDRHFGINPISMTKAMMANIKAGRIKRGGSTLSMQVIRMSRKNRARTFLEKGIEVVLALKLEMFYSKKEILAIYTSHAPFGGNVVGLSAAGWRYFGRPPDKMSWGEAASLAVLPNSPSLVFPGKNEVRLKEKRAFLLRKLLTRGVIDSAIYEMSIEEELPGAPKSLPRWAPRLLTRIVNEGKTGQRIISTLDYELQGFVSERANRYMSRLKHNHIHNAAVLVTDIETGQAVVYVGNVNAGSLHNEQVDIITANRSTGSLLKPFLYAAALDEGLISPKALLPDYPLFYKGFSPKNFDLKYYGAVPANEALTRSLNLPFVNLLIDYGYEKFYEKLKQLGMKSLSNSASHYGLSIILGGAESNLWQLTAMYGNMYRVYQRAIKRPVNQLYESTDLFQNTYVLKENQGKSDLELENDKVLSSASIWATITAMKGLKRPTDYAQWDQLDLSADIAWKTGTSFGFRDAWA
ncbi:MAG: penicillin-binding protein 1C, partial [Reichenbachiella sp.]